jgi:hypothetical protein
MFDTCCARWIRYKSRALKVAHNLATYLCTNVSFSSTGTLSIPNKTSSEVGSGRLAGGADAEQRIAITASSLNLSGYTASELMLLMQENEKKNNARRSHQESETSKPPSREEVIQRYKDSNNFTAGQVFGNGDGRLSTEVRDEVIRRNEARRDKEAAAVLRKKTRLRELISSAIVVKDKMKSETYKAQPQRPACAGEVQAFKWRSENTQYGGRTPRSVESDKKSPLSSLQPQQI